MEHTTTRPVSYPQGCAQPAVSRASSARALLVITVGIISTHHLCTQGYGVPLNSHTPIYPEAPLAQNLTQSPPLPSRPSSNLASDFDQPSPAQRNIFPQRTRLCSLGASLSVGTPVPHLLRAAGFMQHPDLTGSSRWPSVMRDFSEGRAQHPRSISLLYHCLVICKGRNGTEEAMGSSGVSADDKIQRQ